MVTTADWARAKGYSGESVQPAIEGLHHVFPRIACEIALRAIILQGVVLAGYDVDPEPIIEWFQEQGIWEAVSPREQQFLLNDMPTDEESNRFRWRDETEWTLLWMIGKVKVLGLPTHLCDFRLMIDEIIPPVGTDIKEFFTSAELRDPDVLIAEDLRTYDLWCDVCAAHRQKKPLPDDLDIGVLFQRRYAFEWLDGLDEWDDVTCDA